MTARPPDSGRSATGVTDSPLSRGPVPGRTVPPARPSLVVERAGVLTTVQDTGRPGYAHLAVPRSGALDPDALRLANRLVGNPEDAAALELTLSGADLRLTADRWCAVTGAESAVSVGGHPVAFGASVLVPAGALLSVGPSLRGVRAYLAVGGGIAVEPVFGSRSRDTLSGIGPPPLRDHDVLPLGLEHPVPAAVDSAPVRGLPDLPVIRIFPGPRRDWFTAEAWELLRSRLYTVDPRSNRIGVRLHGPPLPRAVPDELPSEGVVRGAVQVPTGGQPLVFLADHPTTGGYPVIAVAHPEDLWMLAQSRPGTVVRFSAVPDGIA